MKKKLLALLLAVVLSAGLLPGTAFAANPGGGIPEALSVQSSGQFNVSITGTQAYAYAYEVADQVNRLRAGLGLSQLVVDPVLMETAMQRAAECAVHYSSSHTRPNGAECFTAFPMRYGVSAENIAAGYSTPAAVMDGWINSPGHYANITNTRVNAIGVGCFYIGGTYYWAQCFTGGTYESSSAKLSDGTATATIPVTGDYISLTSDTGTVSLRAGESRQLTVYNRNLGFYNRSAALSGISGTFLSSGANLVKLDSDTLTITGVSAGSGTVTLRLPNGTALSFTVQVSERFTDVTPADYFYNAVAWAVETQITNGTGNGRFDPKTDCTEGQILTFLYRAAGKPEAAPSPLSVASYYQDAVNWAYGKGMINQSFDQDKPCTRANAVMYIWQAAGKKNAPASSFSDVSAGAAYAGAVNWAVDNGVTKGTGGNQFSPDTVCTREQIVTFLYRAQNHLMA